MDKKCKKCGSEELFIKLQNNGKLRGLYCGNCGAYQKFVSEQEMRVCEYRGYKVIKEIKY